MTEVCCVSKGVPQKRHPPLCRLFAYETKPQTNASVLEMFVACLGGRGTNETGLVPVFAIFDVREIYACCQGNARAVVCETMVAVITIMHYLVDEDLRIEG